MDDGTRNRYRGKLRRHRRDTPVRLPGHTRIERARVIDLRTAPRVHPRHMDDRTGDRDRCEVLAGRWSGRRDIPRRFPGRAVVQRTRIVDLRSGAHVGPRDMNDRTRDCHGRMVPHSRRGREAHIRSPRRTVVQRMLVEYPGRSNTTIIPNHVDDRTMYRHRGAFRPGNISRETRIGSPRCPVIRGALVVDLGVAIAVVVPYDMDRRAHGCHTPGIVERSHGFRRVVRQPHFRLPLRQCRERCQHAHGQRQQTSGSAHLYLPFRIHLRFRRNPSWVPGRRTPPVVLSPRLHRSCFSQHGKIRFTRIRVIEGERSLARRRSGE